MPQTKQRLVTMPPNGAIEASEEVIDDLLDTIPELDGAPGDDEEGDAEDAPRAADAPATAPDPVAQMLAQLRRDLQATLDHEISRVERSFGERIRALDAQLRHADEQLARLAADRQRLAEENAAHERRWRAIRDLAGG